MHESTVSRVTSNKYLSCDRGLFELKYFFTSGIQSNDGGDAASSEAVKSRIKALIARRGADAILSDDQLVEMLKGEGFDIARRTVAKYREAIGSARRCRGGGRRRSGGRRDALGCARASAAGIAGRAVPEARLRAGLRMHGLSRPMAACMAETHGRSAVAD